MTESKSMSRDIYFRNDFYKSGSRFLLKIYKFLSLLSNKSWLIGL